MKCGERVRQGISAGAGDFEERKAGDDRSLYLVPVIPGISRHCGNKATITCQHLITSYNYYTIRSSMKN
jgi:hypothetical protein